MLFMTTANFFFVLFLFFGGTRECAYIEIAAIREAREKQIEWTTTKLFEIIR